MQISAVLMARTYAVFQIEEMNPHGSLFYPELIKKLVERYQFQKYPTKPEEFNETKGIEFHTGKLGDTAIEKVVILNNGIYVDTLSSTDASETILRDAVDWASKEFNLFVRPEMFKRRAYVSNVTFYSEAPMLAFNATMERASKLLTSEVTSNFGQPLTYVPAGMVLTFDPQTTSFGTSAFSILRREGVPWSDNKYFSASPLRTKVHIELLEQIEKDLTRTNR